jgi:hypothetical protein
MMIQGIMENMTSDTTISAGEWVTFTHIGIPYNDGNYWRGKSKYYINGFQISTMMKQYHQILMVTHIPTTVI